MKLSPQAIFIDLKSIYKRRNACLSHIRMKTTNDLMKYIEVI